MDTTAAAVPLAQEPRGEVAIPQLSRRGVLAVWAAAAVPMGVLAWVVAPLVARSLDGPAPLARALIVALAAGLVWQFVLVVFLVHREQGTLRWPVVREALWLRAPRDPRTGRRRGRLWLVLIPALALFAAEEFLPAIPAPGSRDFGTFASSHAGAEMLGGSWGWFAVLVVLWLCNTVLGEELLFRGYLLPRMTGAFGRFDWVVNGLLFSAYHVHVWWATPHTLVDTFALALPSRRYRSALIGIAVHSAQTVLLIGLVLPLVLQG
jgi:membrane protease YdiL (CAAX protease family)